MNARLRPTIFDDHGQMADVLIGKRVADDYLADVLATLADAGWSDQAWADARLIVKRYVQGILEEADQ